MAIITGEEEVIRRTDHHELLVGITLEEEIVQFSLECERITAYPREEVLHKKFSEVLLPIEYLSQWRDLLETIRKTKQIDEFSLPLKTKQNALIQVTWNGFIIKDEQGINDNICLLGTTYQTHSDIQETNTQRSHALMTTPPSDYGAINEDQQCSPSVSPISTQGLQEKTTEQSIIGEKSYDDATMKFKISSLQSIETIVGVTSKKIDDLSQMIEDLSEKYEMISERLGTLERKNEVSGKNKDHPVEHLEPIDKGFRKVTKKKGKTSLPLRFDQSGSSVAEKQPGFFSDPLGYTRQRKDLERKLQECEHRQEELESFEAHLLQEKKIFDSRIEEFRRWRDKLEQLESEIEKRRQELLDQDVALGNRALPIFPPDITDESKDIDVVTPEAPVQQILDGITQSAVIVQRGILKQINTSFAEMIGYQVNEIVEKNFFDFIADDGLEGVEQYYLNRLKGESTSSYTTVFSTKQNEKVMVQVSVKPTIYNGEKAEIAIMTVLESQKHG
ncbi:MAG TPA: PAS domain S-box protein [Candidatus Thermoplasmatota archaeon]|nr:PAS domain S-box protein [Candidatus Thermoplasmatota archaeon]